MKLKNLFNFKKNKPLIIGKDNIFILNNPKNIKILGNYNKIISNDDSYQIKLDIEGNNNTIILGNEISDTKKKFFQRMNFLQLNIKIHGDNNTITLGKEIDGNTFIGIYSLYKVNNCCVEISDYTHIGNPSKILLSENNTKLK